MLDVGLCNFRYKSGRTSLAQTEALRHFLEVEAADNARPRLFLRPQ